MAGAATVGDLGALLDALPEGHLLLAPLRQPDGSVGDFTLVWLNRTAALEAAFAGEKLIGRRLLELHPCLASEPLFPHLLQAAAGGEPVTLAAWPHPLAPATGDSGRRFDIQLVAVDEAVSVVWRDVTEREAARAAAEEGMRLAMENSVVGLCLVSPAGQFLEVNPALCRMLGRDGDSLRRCTWQELTHPDDLAIDLDLVDQVKSGAIENYRLHKRFLRPDGGVLWGDLSVACIRDDEGRVHTFVSQILDVGQLQLAQQVAARAVDERNRILDNIPVAIVCATPDAAPWAEALYVNRCFERSFGYSIGDIPTLENWLHKAFRDDAGRDDFCQRWFEALQQAPARGGHAGPIPVTCVNADGCDRHVEISGVILNEMLIVSLIDVTDTVAAQAELRRREAEFRLLAENASDLVVRAGADGRLEWISPSVTGLLGWTAGELTGRPLRSVVHPEEQSRLGNLLQRVGAGENGSREVRLCRKGGDYRWLDLAFRPLRGATGEVNGWVAGGRDIDQEVGMRRELDHALRHDPLTGLSTRPVMLERLTDALADLDPGQSELAVLSIGIDGLSLMNDAYTHQAGDQVLAQLAIRITRFLGSSDQVGRGTGDEFLVLLPRLASAADADPIAEALRQACQGRLPVGSQSIETTVSVGVATAGQGADPDGLIRDASLALRLAKSRGRNRSEFVDPKLAESARHRLSLLEEIRSGLGRGEFQPWFMPIVNLGDGSLRGYEALVRWIRPDGSVAEPGSFLPAVQQGPLATSLDHAVLSRSIEALAHLPAPLTVAVNLCPASVGQEGLVEVVRELLQRAGAPASRLHLELTESALLTVSAGIRRTIEELAALGVSWYVDDFGTGYSSISHLRDLPIAGLKLDRSFTLGVAAGATRATRLAKGLQGLAEGLDLDTVAEGVKTAEVAARLERQGWRRGQGWLYGKAAPLA